MTLGKPMGNGHPVAGGRGPAASWSTPSLTTAATSTPSAATRCRSRPRRPRSTWCATRSCPSTPRAVGGRLLAALRALDDPRIGDGARRRALHRGRPGRRERPARRALALDVVNALRERRILLARIRARQPHPQDPAAAGLRRRRRRPAADRAGRCAEGALMSNLEKDPGELLVAEPAPTRTSRSRRRAARPARGPARRPARDDRAPHAAAEEAEPGRRLVLRRQLRTRPGERARRDERAAASAHRAADRQLALRRRDRAPRQRGQLRADRAGAGQSDDGGRAASSTPRSRPTPRPPCTACSSGSRCPTARGTRRRSSSTSCPSRSSTATRPCACSSASCSGTPRRSRAFTELVGAQLDLPAGGSVDHPGRSRVRARPASWMPARPPSRACESRARATRGRADRRRRTHRGGGRRTRCAPSSSAARRSASRSSCGGTSSGAPRRDRGVPRAVAGRGDRRRRPATAASATSTATTAARCPRPSCRTCGCGRATSGAPITRRAASPKCCASSS